MRREMNDLCHLVEHNWKFNNQKYSFHLLSVWQLAILTSLSSNNRKQREYEKWYSL